MTNPGGVSERGEGNGGRRREGGHLTIERGGADGEGNEGDHKERNN